MNGSSPTTSQENRLNRFSFDLWNRFVAIAQPYWYPTEKNGGKIFFALVLLLLIFLFAVLFCIVSAAILLVQQIFPTAMAETAGGLVSLIQGIVSSPLVGVVVASLVIPAIAFFLVRQQILSRWQQWAFLSLLLMLSLCVSGMNVLISYVGNFFTTALAEREVSTFWRFFFVYVGVFAIATPFVVYYTYVRDLLGLRWRDWMTGKFLNQYFSDRAYYDIDAIDEIDNPDQRISQDIRSFTETSLAFLLIVLGSVIDVLSFTGILWSISQFLAIFLVGYAIFGTIVMAALGSKLISLNFRQLKREADFRYGLVHVRDNVESIAFYQGEDQEMGQLRRRFVEVLRNFNFLIGWQRNLAFFRTPYRYATYVLPYIILAPAYFREEIQFGDMTQANFAFAQIFEAFALIALQINQLSEFAAGVNRLETFANALKEPDSRRQQGIPKIDTAKRSELSLEHLTLMTPKAQRTLVEDLTLSLNPGEGLVIVGHSGVGKSSVLRAIAGLWQTGNGKVVRPDLSEMLFLPQRPYMVLGCLRDQLLYPKHREDLSVSEEDLRQVLKQVNLEDLPERVDGFDSELDWADVLSLGEQQRLAFARLLLTKPRYAILDEATSALDLENEQRLYDLLKHRDTTFVSVGHRPSLLHYHTYVLELHTDKSWKLNTLEEYQVDASAFT